MKTFLIYIILLPTVLGTSTASGNVNEEGKTFIISHVLSSRYFPPWRKLLALVQGTRKNRYFSQTNFAFA